MVDQELTAGFEALRPTLLRAAYRLLGSLADAEDVVQEAWLRLSRAPRPDEVRDPRAFIMTTVTRLSYHRGRLIVPVWGVETGTTESGVIGRTGRAAR